jgi:hypothetical protein
MAKSGNDDAACGPDEVMLDVSYVKECFKDWELVGDGMVNPEQARRFIEHVADHRGLLALAKLRCMLCGGELTEHDDGTVSGHKADCPHTRDDG